VPRRRSKHWWWPRPSTRDRSQPFPGRRLHLEADAATTTSLRAPDPRWQPVVDAAAEAAFRLPGRRLVARLRCGYDNDELDSAPGPRARTCGALLGHVWRTKNGALFDRTVPMKADNGTTTETRIISWFGRRNTYGDTISPLHTDGPFFRPPTAERFDQQIPEGLDPAAEAEFREGHRVSDGVVGIVAFCPRHRLMDLAPEVQAAATALDDGLQSGPGRPPGGVGLLVDLICELERTPRGMSASWRPPDILLRPPITLVG
jgi:hypothetical protein